MDTGCCCGGKTVMLMACSGGSNVGQLSNEVARRLTVEGKGLMFCMAGVGGQVPNIVQQTKDAERVIVIDGCSVACAKKAMELAGCTEFEWVDLTATGIEKTKDLELEPEQISTARMAVEAML